jgi:hypothetical protein
MDYFSLVSTPVKSCWTIPLRTPYCNILQGMTCDNVVTQGDGFFGTKGRVASSYHMGGCLATMLGQSGRGFSAHDHLKEGFFSLKQQVIPRIFSIVPAQSSVYFFPCRLKINHTKEITNVHLFLGLFARM